MLRRGLPSALTGPVGARTNRPVVLVTDDFRLYHELAPFFDLNGLPLLGLGPGEPVPASVKVVIGGEPADRRHVPLRADPVATWLSVVQALDARVDGPYRRIIVGVDPGETVGVAILADGAVLWFDDLFAAAATAATVASWLEGLQSTTVAIHLGDGAPDIGAALRAAFKEHDLPVFTVKEDSSTPQSPRTKSRHTDAAIRIAMRDPWADA